ncbi:MAG: hypothetical protein JNL08_07305 [Planctomycetes bacterium]|nr:hypothetical protein [Planctomycetota bacterium]
MKDSRSSRFPRLAALAVGLAGLGVVAVLASRERPRPTPNAPAAEPPRQLTLVHAERWTTAQPFHHVWRADRPLVASGWLLVLAGDPAQMVPHQVAEPVLYVGAETADRVNTGQGSGKLVVIVPGDFWLEDAPIFYGREALPEALRQPWIDRELATAQEAGATAPTAEQAAAVTAEPRAFANDYELRLRAIDLVERFAPDEKDLIAGWRAPLVK